MATQYLIDQGIHGLPVLRYSLDKLRLVRLEALSRLGALRSLLPKETVMTSDLAMRSPMHGAAGVRRIPTLFVKGCDLALIMSALYPGCADSTGWRWATRYA